jgi:hypothetical protein
MHFFWQDSVRLRLSMALAGLSNADESRPRYCLGTGIAEEETGASYRLNISETISTSVSAAAIFSAEDILGGPPKRKDMVMVFYGGSLTELCDADNCEAVSIRQE